MRTSSAVFSKQICSTRMTRRISIRTSCLKWSRIKPTCGTHRRVIHIQHNHLHTYGHHTTRSLIAIGTASIVTVIMNTWRLLTVPSTRADGNCTWMWHLRNFAKAVMATIPWRMFQSKWRIRMSGICFSISPPLSVESISHWRSKRNLAILNSAATSGLISLLPTAWKSGVLRNPDKLLPFPSRLVYFLDSKMISVRIPPK